MEYCKTAKRFVQSFLKEILDKGARIYVIDTLVTPQYQRKTPMGGVSKLDFISASLTFTYKIFRARVDPQSYT